MEYNNGEKTIYFLTAISHNMRKYNNIIFIFIFILKIVFWNLNYVYRVVNNHNSLFRTQAIS